MPCSTSWATQDQQHLAIDQRMADQQWYWYTHQTLMIMLWWTGYLPPYTLTSQNVKASVISEDLWRLINLPSIPQHLTVWVRQSGSLLMMAHLGKETEREDTVVSRCKWAGHWLRWLIFRLYMYSILCCLLTYNFIQRHYNKSICWKKEKQQYIAVGKVRMFIEPSGKH